MSSLSTETATLRPLITPDQMLAHWQGHRDLTRRVIDAFPDDKLFTFTIGGMRPFGEMAMELVSAAAPMAKGIAIDEWGDADDRSARPKAEVLRLWDEGTKQIDEWWPQISPERFQETITAFGQWSGRAYTLLLYAIDNEIHHRGQGYVYLRALDIEPPAFYDRP